ncbi:MAG: Gx transporter family protein [Clostridia bacterium]|nr:Gx transporter family protein [Clostridia bacterium]
MERKKTTIKKVAFLGIMGALALSLSFLESLIPPLPGIPPGAKPGLANVVTMFLASSAGVADAFGITIIKAVFAGITRGTTAMLMSAAGGLLSTLAACILLRSKKIKLGYIGIGIICAVCHNIGQLTIACFLSGTWALVTGYGPFLMLFAVATGFVTGTTLKLVLPALEKTFNRL